MADDTSSIRTVSVAVTVDFGSLGMPYRQSPLIELRLGCHNCRLEPVCWTSRRDPSQSSLSTNSSFQLEIVELTGAERPRLACIVNFRVGVCKWNSQIYNGAISPQLP